MDGGKNACGVDQHCILWRASKSGLDSSHGLVGHIVALIEAGQIDERGGSLYHGGYAPKIGFGGGIFLLLLLQHGAQTLCTGRGLGLQANDERLRLVRATTDHTRCVDVELAEITRRMEGFRVQLEGSLELVANFPRQAEGSEGTRVSGLHAVGATKPEMTFAARWCIRDGQFALVNRGVR